MTDSAFDGFPRAGLDFLADLGTQDKAWFTEHKKTYAAEVVQPAKTFVAAMGAALADAISPAIAAIPKTNGSIAPINNDLRFSPDGSPYKDHLLFRFWEGPTKKSAPMLMVRLHPTDGVGFASGVAFADLARWRAKIDADETGGDFARALDDLVAETGCEVMGAELKRVPKPFSPEHPRADLLRHKSFQARWILPTPDSIVDHGFVDWCVDELVRSADVHRWLVAELT